ncbi:MAG: adenylosuccinate synthase [Planctomycetota bacterium]|nr:MAG: adenylosuccinate synthase [Planctomycetota bacterium]
MATTSIIGAQWGDEGKGKYVDLLTEKADVIVRFQGGANAGHTVIVKDDKFVLHLLPSGILHDNKISVIAQGVVVDIESLLNEIEELKERCGDVTTRLLISDRAHLVMPYHKILDKASEESLGDKKIGTTGRGIGPCYTDKYSRKGIRMAELLRPDIFESRLKENVERTNQILTKLYNKEAISHETILKTYLDYAEKIKHMICDTSIYVETQIKEGKNILFEGAQGSLLDIEMGTYPFVTSSHTISGGISTGTGIGPHHIEKIIGVVKAYTTRVGAGPFPTEDFTNAGTSLQDKGHEFGATTGRKRRCGWIDIVSLKHAIRASGINSIAITKLDVLSGENTIKICTAYELNGENIQFMPALASDLDNVTPIYEEMPGFDEDITGCKTYDELPQNAKNYLMRLEELLEVRIDTISIHPERNKTIFR